MFSTLPTELLLRIFQDGDYFTLLYLSNTCQRFRYIIQSHFPGAISHRYTPITPKVCGATIIKPPTGKKLNAISGAFKINPCFKLLQLCDPEFRISTQQRDSWKENIGFKTSDGQFIPIKDSKMAEEPATWPATEFIYLNIYDVDKAPNYGKWRGTNYRVKCNGGRFGKVIDVVERVGWFIGYVMKVVDRFPAGKRLLTVVEPDMEEFLLQSNKKNIVAFRMALGVEFSKTLE